MIERYALYDIDKLRDRFTLTAGVPKGVKKQYNIQPAQAVPVVLQRGDDVVMELMQWGFVPQNAKDTNSIFRYKTFVVRSEDIFKKDMWDRAVRSQRCLVPVNGFYFWSAITGGKAAFYTEVKGQPIAALAGVYSSWTNSEGIETGMVSVVTVPANDDAIDLTDRLPVIVQPGQEKAWIDPTSNEVSPLYDTMRMAADNSLSLRRVGDGIFSKKRNDDSLIKAT